MEIEEFKAAFGSIITCKAKEGQKYSVLSLTTKSFKEKTICLTCASMKLKNDAMVTISINQE